MLTVLSLHFGRLEAIRLYASYACPQIGIGLIFGANLLQACLGFFMHVFEESLLG